MEPTPDRRRMEVEVERDELNGLLAEWIPALPSKHPPPDGFQVALVGIFEDESRPWQKRLPHLLQRCQRIRHVMQCPNHAGGVEDPIGKGQMVRVGSDKRVPIAATQARLSLLQLGR
jgi:hypothetical protein